MRASSNNKMNDFLWLVYVLYQTELRSQLRAQFGSARLGSALLASSGKWQVWAWLASPSLFLVLSLSLSISLSRSLSQRIVLSLLLWF